MAGASAKEWEGSSSRPPVAVTGSRVRATVNTSNSAAVLAVARLQPGLEAGAREDLQGAGHVERGDAVEDQDADTPALTGPPAVKDYHRGIGPARHIHVSRPS